MIRKDFDNELNNLLTSAEALIGAFKRGNKPPLLAGEEKKL